MSFAGVIRPPLSGLEVTEKGGNAESRFGARCGDGGLAALDGGLVLRENIDEGVVS